MRVEVCAGRVVVVVVAVRVEDVFAVLPAADNLVVAVSAAVSHLEEFPAGPESAAGLDRAAAETSATA